MTKKYLSVAFAYVGVIVGAGLASGQDLLQYFLAFGAKGLIGIVALGVLNVIFGVVPCSLARTSVQIITTRFSNASLIRCCVALLMWC